MRSYKYIILGGGTTAGYAAREFVRQDIGKGELCIISAESMLPMNRLPFSKSYLKDEKQNDEILINEDIFYDANGIDVRLKTCARSVNTKLKTIELDTGEKVKYDKLLIATGSTLHRLDVKGSDLGNVFYLRNRIQSDKIRLSAIDTNRAVVVGGGFIGCETAAVLSDLGLKVTMVMSSDHLLSKFADSDIAYFFDKLYKKHGVNLIYSDRVTAFHGNGKVDEVELASGRRIKTGMVVVGSGVEPNVKIFEGSGLAIRNGILVNEFCETNVDGIYAAGDVTEFPDPIYHKMRHVEHWENAVEQGEHVAKVMTGHQVPYVFVPYFFSDFFNLSYDFYGDQEKADYSATRGIVANGNFSHWWFNGDKLAAAFIMSSRPQEEGEKARSWILNGTHLNRAMISNEKVELKELELK